MNVDDIVAARIAAARARIEATRKRRLAQQTARAKGLAQRHAAKLRAQADPRRPQAVDNPEEKETNVIRKTTVVALGDGRNTTFRIQTVRASGGQCSSQHGACGRPGVAAVRNTISHERPTETSTLRITVCTDHQAEADRMHELYVADARQFQDPVKHAEFLAAAGVDPEGGQP